MNKVFEEIIEKLDEIKALTPILVEYQEADDIENRCSEIIDMVTEYNNGWIPCSSGNLPGDLEDVLIDMGGTKPIPAYIHNREWYLTDCRGSSEKVKDQTRVEAWHPLPEQYRPCTNTDCVYNSGNECPASEGCAGYETKGGIR